MYPAGTYSGLMLCSAPFAVSESYYFFIESLKSLWYDHI